MVVVFAFLGEFGYELLNWQGVIRHFARTRKQPSDVIVCCSRGQVYPLYEHADLYVDVTAVPVFRHSRACCYHATLGAGSPDRLPNRVLDAWLRRTLRSVVLHRLREARPEWAAAPPVFVFSSSRTVLGGLAFGCEPGRLEREPDVCDPFDVSTNCYTRVAPDPDPRVRASIEGRLGFSLDEPYVLIQSRSRRVGPRSTPVHPEPLIRALAERIRVVLLSFRTGRAFDSGSQLGGVPGCHGFQARTFPEQACLVAHAHRCVFFTEGDFGSHMYVPPFMGRDVTSIVPDGVYTRYSAPIEYWNRHVFQFGGRIRPLVAEQVLAHPRSVQDTADAILDEPPASSHAHRHLR